MHRRTTVAATLIAACALVGLALVVLRPANRRRVPAGTLSSEPIELDATIAIARPIPRPDAGAVRASASDDGRPPPSVKTDGADYPNEASLMAKLRDLRATDPQLSLKLAREGNARFPESEEADERAWFIAKSLSALGRFAEAQQVARSMVDRNPNSSWSRDVQRHVLSTPPY